MVAGVVMGIDGWPGKDRFFMYGKCGPYAFANGIGAGFLFLCGSL